jgi:transposase-like protein
MKSGQFKALVASVGDLTLAQLKALGAVVAATKSKHESREALESIRPKTCAHCGSAAVVKNGVRNGLQRYSCRACARTFNATTGTALSRLRDKEQFAAYAECLRQGLSIRAAAAKLGLTWDKAFRWRHRFLESVVGQQPIEVPGLLEVDETYFRESQKGSRKLTRLARHRGGSAKGTGSGRKAADWVPVLVGRVRGQPFTADKVLKKLNGIEVADALRGVVKPGETILCTDGHSAFLPLQSSLGVTTKYFLASRHGHSNPLDKVYHVQTANNYHEQLKTWIQRGLRGVSTKHLPNYLAWHRLLSWNNKGVSTIEVIHSAMGRQIINL